MCTCRSKQARVAKPQKTAAPDVFYDTDEFRKQSLATKVACSPVLYANMARSKVQRSGFTAASSCPPDVGPGSYTAPVKSDIRVSLVLNQNPLSRCEPCVQRSANSCAALVAVRPGNASTKLCGLVQHAIARPSAGHRQGGPNKEPWKYMEARKGCRLLESRRDYLQECPHTVGAKQEHRYCGSRLTQPVTAEKHLFVFYGVSPDLIPPHGSTDCVQVEQLRQPVNPYGDSESVG